MDTANEKRRKAIADAEGLREYIADDRPHKALEYLHEDVAWLAFEAIAEGCDDPESLAEVIGQIRREVVAAVIESEGGAA